MNPHRDRLRPADDPGHLEAQEALPWLANGRLAGPELERIWSHVHACACCRADLARLHTWRHALQAVEGGPAAQVDLDAALVRLQAIRDLPVRPRMLPAAAPDGRLVVLFRPETPEREMRRIVRANGARIVGGPTAADAYLLAADGDLGAVLVGLHAETAVTWAEPFTRESRS